MQSQVSILAIIIGIGSPVSAENQFSFYIGEQTAPHSIVTGSDPSGIGDFDFTAGWEGRSFEAPPHYGFRATHWLNENWGISLDFNHTKVYAEDATLGAGGTSGGFERLEFTDGLNNLTLNAEYRWSNQSRKWRPFAGAGIGVVIPRVEVQTQSGAPLTDEYQFGGPSVMLHGGIEYDLNQDWSVFGDYKITYSQLDVDLNGGGSLQTNIVTNSFNLGISRRF